jgi:hypothetical protein
MLYDYEIMISALEFNNFNNAREVEVVILDSSIKKQDQVKWFCGWEEGIARITRINGVKYTIKKMAIMPKNK